MSNIEIIIATLVIAGIIGQAWIVSGGRRRLDRQIRQLEAESAAKKAKLIEDEFDKQNRETK